MFLSHACGGYYAERSQRSNKFEAFDAWVLVRGHLTTHKDRFRQEHYLPRILNLDWKDYDPVSSIVQTGGEQVREIDKYPVTGTSACLVSHEREQAWLKRFGKVDILTL